MQVILPYRAKRSESTMAQAAITAESNVRFPISGHMHVAAPFYEVG